MTSPPNPTTLTPAAPRRTWKPDNGGSCTLKNAASSAVFDASINTVRDSGYVSGYNTGSGFPGVLATEGSTAYASCAAGKTLGGLVFWQYGGPTQNADSNTVSRCVCRRPPHSRRCVHALHTYDRSSGAAGLCGGSPRGAACLSCAVSCAVRYAGLLAPAATQLRRHPPAPAAALSTASARTKAAARCKQAPTSLATRNPGRSRR